MRPPLAPATGPSESPAAKSAMSAPLGHWVQVCHLSPQGKHFSRHCAQPLSAEIWTRDWELLRLQQNTKFYAQGAMKKVDYALEASSRVEPAHQAWLSRFHCCATKLFQRFSVTASILSQMQRLGDILDPRQLPIPAPS